MKAGERFLMPAPGLGKTPHLWIVILEAGLEDRVIVSVTTLRESKDQTIILQPSDHPFIVHPSIIFYGDARIVQASQLATQLKAGLIRSHSPCSAKLVQEIVNGLFASEHTKRKIITFCREALKKP